MLIDWIVANIGSIAVGLVVLAVVASCVVLMVRDKKKGKSSSCGCSCSSCPMAGKCHEPSSNQK